MGPISYMGPMGAGGCPQAGDVLFLVLFICLFSERRLGNGEEGPMYSSTRTV